MIGVKIVPRSNGTTGMLGIPLESKTHMVHMLGWKRYGEKDEDCVVVMGDGIGFGIFH